MSLKFSQRRGLKPIRETIQVDSIDDDLRTALWNAVLKIWNALQKGQYYDLEGDMRAYCSSVWADHFKLTLDAIPKVRKDAVEIIRKYYMAAKWYEVYDFIEFTANYFYKEDFEAVYSYFNGVLESELAGYRFVNGELTDITDKQELAMLEEAIDNSTFSGVSTHLATALSLYSDRDNPDYRNSIKESISAVESMARIVTGQHKATLGQALKTLKKNGTVHPALITGFESLYGYTSDEDGIRHSMQAEPDLTASDAKYFLLSCTSFVNYLKSKMSA